MQLEMFATPFERAQAEFELALENATKANQKMIELRKQRDVMCPHTNIVARENYFGGSYYDKASTDYWNECVCCGAKSEVITEMHSWYG